MRTQTSQHSRFRHPTILFFFFEESINDSFVSPYETRVSIFLSRPDNLAFSQVPGTARDHTGPRSAFTVRSEGSPLLLPSLCLGARETQPAFVGLAGKSVHFCLDMSQHHYYKCLVSLLQSDRLR